MIMPMCSDGVHDMFPVVPWNLTAYGEDCKAKYGVTIQPYFIESLYGGKNISSHSNIIFRWVVYESATSHAAGVKIHSPTTTHTLLFMLCVF